MERREAFQIFHEQFGERKFPNDLTPCIMELVTDSENVFDC